MDSATLNATTSYNSQTAGHETTFSGESDIDGFATTDSTTSFSPTTDGSGGEITELTSTQPESKNWLYGGLGFLIGSVVTLLVLAFIYWYRYRKNHRPYSESDVELQSDHTPLSDATKDYYYNTPSGGSDGQFLTFKKASEDRSEQKPPENQYVVEETVMASTVDQDKIEEDDNAQTVDEVKMSEEPHVPIENDDTLSEPINEEQSLQTEDHDDHSLSDSAQSATPSLSDYDANGSVSLTPSVTQVPGEVGLSVDETPAENDGAPEREVEDQSQDQENEEGNIERELSTRSSVIDLTEGKTLET